jgi:hypothetical protein
VFSDVQGNVGDASPLDVCLQPGVPANPTDYIEQSPPAGRDVLLELTRPIVDATLAFSDEPDLTALLVQQGLNGELLGWSATSGSLAITNLGADGFDFLVVGAQMIPGAGGLGTFTATGCGSAPP